MTRRTLSFSVSQAGPDPQTVVANSLRADKIGYDYLWMADHLTDPPPVVANMDCWTVLGYVGSKTDNIKLASGVTDIQRIHPAKTASIVATLDRLTRGRAVLGIGAGEIMNVKPYGMEWDPVPVRIRKFREQLMIIVKLWSSSYANPVNFEGEFYKLENAHLDLAPHQKPHPPIYVGAFASPRMLAIAGELGDGWFTGTLNTPESFKERADIIKSSAREHGGRVSEIDLVVNIPVIVDTDPAVRRKVKQKFKRSLVFNRHLMKILEIEDLLQKIPRELEYQLFPPTVDYGNTLDKAIAGLPVPDQILEFAVENMMALGSVDKCVSSIERFVKAGATNIHITPNMADWKNNEVVARKIIPHFKS